MNRFYKAVLYIAAGIALLAILAVVIAKIVFTKERILAALTPRIEAAVNRPVTIGEAGIGFTGGIGVWLGDVTIGNAPGFSDEPLLTLHRFDLKARFWPLLTGRVELDRVVLTAPSLLLEYTEDGRTNLEGLVSDSANADTATFPSDADRGGPALSVDRIVITDGGFIRRPYRGAPVEYIDGIAATLSLTGGVVSDGPLGFVAEIGFDSLELVTDDAVWVLSDGDPSLKMQGTWDRESSITQVESLELNWFSTNITGRGMLRRHQALSEIQLVLNLSKTPLEAFTRLIAQTYGQSALTAVAATLQGEASIAMPWPLPEGKVPEWRMQLDVEDLRWTPPGRDEELSMPRLELRGEEQTLSWSGPSGRFGDGTLSLSGTLDRLFSDEPTVSARVRAHLPIGSLLRSLDVDPEIDGDGFLDCDLSAFGPMGNWRAARIAGSVTSEGLTVRDTSWLFDSVRAAFQIRSDGERLAIRSLDWIAGRSSGHVTGGVTGLMAYVRSDFAPHRKPSAELNLRSPYLDLDELIGDQYDTLTSADAGEKSDDDSHFDFTARGTMTADTVHYTATDFMQMTSDFKYEDKILKVDPLRGRVYSGRLRGSLTWDLNNWERPAFDVRVRADSVEADGILTRYFDWANGILGEVELDAQFSGHGRFAAEILPSLLASGRADLKSGRLEAAPLLASVGQATGLKGFDQPRTLRDLSFPFRIEKGRVKTDALRFVTGDVRIEAEGDFGLDRSLNLQVMATGLPGSGSLSDLSLPFSLKGTITQPQIAIDSKRAAGSVLQKLLPDNLKSDKIDSTAKDKVKQTLQNLLKSGKP